MPTIGDVLFSVRSAIPDMPPTLPAPTATAIVATAAGATIPIGAYYVVVTQSNPWGETLGSAEIGPLTLTVNDGVQVTSALLPGATTIRAYLTLAGGISGSEIQFTES